MWSAVRIDERRRRASLSFLEHSATSAFSELRRSQASFAGSNDAPVLHLQDAIGDIENSGDYILDVPPLKPYILVR